MNVIYSKPKFVLIILLFSCSCTCQNPRTTDPYNLSFDESIGFLSYYNSWTVSGCLANDFTRDTVTHIQGKASAKIVTRNCDKFCKKSLKIFQLLKAPEYSSVINISFSIKCSEISTGFFRVMLLDKDGKITGQKEVKILPNAGWMEVKTAINKSNEKLFYLEFEFGSYSTVWIDDLKIKLKDVDYNEYLTNREISCGEKNLQTTKFENVPLENFQSKVLAESKRVKVFAIGESTHGNHEFSKIRNDIVKELVLKAKYRLIILEAPDVFVDDLNKCIHGIYSFDNILTEAALRRTQYMSLTEEMKELLVWLKEYNDTHNEKVELSGMDVSYDWYGVVDKYLIIRKFASFDKIGKLKDFKNNSKSDSILSLIKNYKSYFIASIGQSGYDSLIYTVTRLHRYISVYSGYFDNQVRDSIMAVNILEKVMESPDNKAILFCHLTHLNKERVYNSIVPSTGHYLNNALGNDYFVLALIAGSGKFQAYQIDTTRLNIQSLKLPECESVEFYCSKLSDKPFYAMTNQPFFKDKIMPYRFTGGIPRNIQFFSGNIEKAFDSFIYLPEVTPLKLLPIYKALRDGK